MPSGIRWAGRFPVFHRRLGVRSYLEFMHRFFLPLITFGFPAISAPAQSPTPIRVMSFNIRYATAPDGANHWDKRRDFLVETVNTFAPDLLGTQETLVSQRDFLAEKLPGFESFAAGRDDGRNKGEMAALFYRTARFTKTADGHFWLSESPESVGKKGWDAALPRIATWVKLTDRTDRTGKSILFLNTHFDHMGKTARTESARLIRKKLVELGSGCRLIVTGDFNAGEGSEPYKALFAADDQPPAVVDTYRAIMPTKTETEGTFNGFKPTAVNGPRIDWIGCSRDWDVRLAGIDRTARDGRVPSDHFPVTAVLRASGQEAKRSLRVLSYNIHHGEGTDGKVDLPRLAGVIRDADADLVALQEVDDKTKRTLGVDQTAELARLTGMHGRFGKAIDYQGGGYGQSILSRTPTGMGEIHWLPGEPDRERRIAFAVPVTIDGLTFKFATTHLHHANESYRLRQAKMLNELFAKSTTPVILAGDLNAYPESPPLAELKPIWTISKGDALLTFPAGKPTRQIDYVLSTPAKAFTITSTRVIDEPVASDHRPILAVLEQAK